MYTSGGSSSVRSSTAQQDAKELYEALLGAVASDANLERFDEGAWGKVRAVLAALSPIGKGTELGLSMIYGYAKQSGGDVTIYSHLGVGTTITIFLPCAAEDDAAHPERESSAPAQRGNGERILVVEDESDVRAVIVAVLAEYGYGTSDAHDATSALVHLRGTGHFDLLLTDVGLPGMSGRELALEPQRVRPELKVLFVTGYARSASVCSEFLGSGMDMMPKPFAIEDLATRVYRLTHDVDLESASRSRRCCTSRDCYRLARMLGSYGVRIQSPRSHNDAFVFDIATHEKPVTTSHSIPASSEADPWASGEMNRRIEAFDWSSTGLGAKKGWPTSLRTLVELLLNAKQPMFLAWGNERTWVYNDAFIPIAGNKHPSSLGLTALEVWAEAWVDLQPFFDRVFAGESIHLTDFKVGLDRHGVVEDAYFDFSYTPVRGDEGDAVQGLFGVCIETTSRVVLARQQLAVAGRERARILEMSRDLFAVASFDGQLHSVNPAWSRQLGRPESEILARPFSEIIHPDDLAETANVVAALISGLPVHQFHVRLLKADGSPVSYAWSAVPELDPPNGTFYTVGRDITEERAALLELQAAQEALRQSQKMEAIGQLTGGIAHDFNNLLAGVSASLQVLEMRLGQGKLEGVERYIGLGMKSIRRAAALTQRLLAFSRRQTLDPKPTDVNRLVSGMEELIRRTVGPTIELEVIGAGGLWPTRIDASQLENALLNLCINARDAMPDGGKLTVESANKWLDERAARERELQPGQYVSLCVSDTGSGMDDHVKARAFDPFFTTKPIGQGTGLGLSMVYGFVRQSGGQVRIYSELGKGTTMCLYLPRYVGELEVEDSVILSEPAAHGDGETVLVVEDETTIRALLAEVLSEAGFQVLESDDGASGLRILESTKRVDLLVTDVGLPGGMNGRQLADAARVTRPNLKALFITGYADNAAVGNGLLSHGMDVMTKPFEITALVNKVRDMIDKA